MADETDKIPSLAEITARLDAISDTAAKAAAAQELLYNQELYSSPEIGTIVDTLIAAGANVNGTGKYPPLHTAASENNVRAIEILIGKGADINLGDGFDNDTPLHIAVLGNNQDAVRALIGNGASIKTNGKGETPLDIAERDKNSPVIEILNSATTEETTPAVAEPTAPPEPTAPTTTEPAPPVEPEVPAKEPVVNRSVSTTEPPAHEESALPPPVQRKPVAVVEPVKAQRPEEQLPSEAVADLKFLGIRRPEQLETKLPESVKSDGKIDAESIAEAAVEKAIKKADGGLFKLKDGVLSEPEFEKLLRRNPEAAATLQRHGVKPQSEDEIREIKDHQKEDRRLGRGDDTPDDERRRPLKEFGKGLKALLSGEGRVREADDDNKAPPPRAERHNREAGRD